MPVSAAERRFILNNLTRLAQADVRKLWAAAERQSDTEFAAYVIEAFPQIVDPYHQLAAQTAASLFESDFPDISAPATPAEPLPAQQLMKSAQWALGANGKDALDRMFGTVQRAVFDGDRVTTVKNTEQHGMRWVRVARADACAFCRMLASRTTAETMYRSEAAATTVVGRSVSLSTGDRRKVRSGFWTKDQALAFRDQASQVYQRDGRYGKKGDVRTKRLRKTGAKVARTYGEDYHDHCFCTAKSIPAGWDAMDYLSSTEPEFADLAAQWNNEYVKASEAANSSDPKKILSSWREQGVK